MKTFALVAMVALIGPVSVFARLGETERELIARFGEPASRARNVIITQGRTVELGPKLNFRQGDWYIVCDMIDDRCARIGYSKSGGWTEDQCLTVLTSNAQGAKWTEITPSAQKTFQREWKREDGAKAIWTQVWGMSVTTPAYERAKAIAEAKAKAAANQIPHI